jgi:hypothetical protein
MAGSSRRAFLVQVGQGMLAAGVGYGAAVEMGLSPALADQTDGPATLSFGKLEPLVRLMQQTPADKLMPKAVAMLGEGTSLQELVAAAALANARAFGGEDYVGFHTLMALAPSYDMAQRLPADRQPLPVLKVLYRNASRLQEQGGLDAQALRPVEPAALPDGDAGQALRQLVHRGEREQAERLFAAIAQRSADDAFNDLLLTVEDAHDVHRVVLAHRAWDMLELVGRDHALTMLRQSLRYCLRNEPWSAKNMAEPRTLLPKLMDQYKLAALTPGSRSADDAWIDQFSQTIFASTAAQAADAVAAALADGMSPDAVGEAIALASNQLVLRDSGRREGQTQPNKPLGSVHGDSIGVHACDSAHAWRQIARVSNARNTTASLVMAGFQVAYDRVHRGGDFLEWKPRPFEEHLEKLKADDADGLLRELDGAIRENNQAQACAAAQRYGDRGFAPKPIFDLLLRYATTEDGALHAEKFYRTTSDEFAATRPAFRWRQVVALARVTASEYGTRAPGIDQACELLNVKV